MSLIYGIWFVCQFPPSLTSAVSTTFLSDATCSAFPQDHWAVDVLTIVFLALSNPIKQAEINLPCSHCKMFYKA